METDYNNKHKLNRAGIENRQAAIRGRPKVNNEDAHTIVNILIAIKGARHKESHAGMGRRTTMRDA